MPEVDSVPALVPGLLPDLNAPPPEHRRPFRRWSRALWGSASCDLFLPSLVGVKAGLGRPCVPTGLALSTSLPGCGHLAAQCVKATLCHRLYPWGTRLGLADPRSHPCSQGLLLYMFFLLVTLLAFTGVPRAHNHAYTACQRHQAELAARPSWPSPGTDALCAGTGLSL